MPLFDKMNYKLKLEFWTSLRNHKMPNSIQIDLMVFEVVLRWKYSVFSIKSQIHLTSSIELTMRISKELNHCQWVQKSWIQHKVFQSDNAMKLVVRVASANDLERFEDLQVVNSSQGGELVARQSYGKSIKLTNDCDTARLKWWTLLLAAMR